MIDHNPLTHQFYLKEIERQTVRSRFLARENHSERSYVKRAAGALALLATVALLVFTGHTTV